MGDMRPKSGFRSGDTDGDTRPAKSPDSPVLPRRPRRTKPPAKVAGCEHRWFPAVGWKYRARSKVGGIVKVGEWATKEQAMRDAAAMRERRAAADGIEFVTLEGACQAVLDTVKGNAGTWRSYEEHFMTLCDFFGTDAPLHTITPARIDEFVTDRRAARWRGRPISDKRIRKHLGALGRVFRLAIRKSRFAGANPLDRVERPKAGKRRHKEVFTIDELGNVFAALRKRTTKGAAWDTAVVAALAFSGLRREGLCRVTVSMVDNVAGFIRGLEQKETTGSVVPITKPLVHVLPALVAGADADGYLIPKGALRGPRKEGRRPRTDTERRTGTIDRVFRRCRGSLPETLRARFHPHTLRHSFRTMVADASVPRHVADALTDHAPRSQGESYEHPSPASVRAWAAKVLDPLLWVVDESAERPKAVAE